MAEEICINDILGMKKSKAKIANRINVIETKYLPPQLCYLFSEI